MQNTCPLEKNLFLFEKNKKVIKHLKKCPLFLKYLNFHYNPFYFSHINDSFYLLEGSNVEDILSEYYILFDKLIDLVKNHIKITKYEQFLILKYNILLKYYLKYGENYLLMKLKEDSFIEKLNRNIHNDTENLIDINLNSADDFLNYHIDKLKHLILEKRENTNNNNDVRNEQKKINNLEFISKEKENYETYEKREDYFYEMSDTEKNNNVINEKYRINNSFSISVDLKKKNKKFTLPILNLESIGNIHNYKIIRDLVNYIDANIFLNEKNDKEKNLKNKNFDYILIEKENFNKDEILSIVLYLAIYLCCKMNVIKRIKNKSFNREQCFDSITMSIYFFLENLGKHDVQNINILFLLLYYNNTFIEYFQNLFNRTNSLKNNNKHNLFIELGAGKGNTTRWLNFIMNNLGEIVTNFFFNELNEVKNQHSYDNGSKNDIFKKDFNSSNKNKTSLEELQKEKCKILIIEKESVRNKKEKKDFLMQIVQNNDKDMHRIKADISDFNLSKFIYFIKNGTLKSKNMCIPDIIHFYYFENIYNKKKIDQLNNSVKKENEKKEYNELNNNINFLISGDYLKHNLIFIENYFDVNVKKLYSFLTQGNSNILKVYNNMNLFLNNFDCQKVIFLSKHLCGNGTDLALRMLVNNVKNNDIENYFILAPCCHHRCDVKRILGFKYLKKLNIDKKYFQYMVNHMSGYASCNSKIKQSIGKKVKQVIDLVRVLYLLEEGLENAYLIKYVNRNITLESYAIIFFNHQKLNLRNFKYY